MQPDDHTPLVSGLTGVASPPDIELAQGSRYSPPADHVSSWVEATMNTGNGTVSFESGTGTSGAASGLPLLNTGQPPRPKAKATAKKLPQAVQRKWLMVEQNGNTSMVSLSKNELTQVLGIQLRDLR